MSSNNIHSVELRRDTLHAAKWLTLRKIVYNDPKGTERNWEVVERSTKGGAIDGVDILATVRGNEGKEDQIVLVKQYRPPLAKFVIEFPAGLVDAAELPEAAAIRELHEETGYKGTITRISPLLALEPGLTSATTVLVEMDCVDPPAKQELTEDEFIDVITVPKSKLYDKLIELSKECVIDSKVYTYGLMLSMK